MRRNLGAGADRLPAARRDRRGTRAALPALVALAFLACTAEGGKVQALDPPPTGTLRLGVQPILGGPNGDPAAIRSVRVRAVPEDGFPVEYDLFPLGDGSHAWELPTGQEMPVGTYVFSAKLHADPEAEPGEDDAIFGTISATATVYADRETSVLILAGPRPVLPQSAAPFLESVVIEPSSANLREEVRLLVEAGGGTGALTARLRAPAWGEGGYESWVGEAVALEAGAGILRWKVPPTPDLSALALRVEDERGAVAEAGVALVVGLGGAHHPLTWNLPPVAALSGSLHQGEGVELHLTALLSDDRSADLEYGWESDCQLTFSPEGAAARASFAQPVGLEGSELPFRIAVESEEEACTLTLWVEDEEGGRGEASVFLDLRELHLSFGDGGGSDD